MIDEDIYVRNLSEDDMKLLAESVGIDYESVPTWHGAKIFNDEQLKKMFPNSRRNDV